MDNSTITALLWEAIVRKMWAIVVAAALALASAPADSEEIGTYGEWVLWEEVDQMTDVRHLTLWNSGVDSGIPENSALALGVNCRRGVPGTVELLMTGGDTLVYDDYDAFGLLQRVRVRFDDRRVQRTEFTFLDDTGTAARTFPMSRDTMLFHQRMEGARKALVEVRTYSEGKVVYEFDLSGFTEALEACD